MKKIIAPTIQGCENNKIMDGKGIAQKPGSEEAILVILILIIMPTSLQELASTSGRQKFYETCPRRPWSCVNTTWFLVNRGRGLLEYESCMPPFLLFFFFQTNVHCTVLLKGTWVLESQGPAVPQPHCIPAPSPGASYWTSLSSGFPICKIQTVSGQSGWTPWCQPGSATYPRWPGGKSLNVCLSFLLWKMDIIKIPIRQMQ